MEQVIKSVIFRFIRTFVAGAVAVMLTVAPLAVKSWNDLPAWLSSLALAGIIGGVAGVLTATDKYLRAE